MATWHLTERPPPSSRPVPPEPTLMQPSVIRVLLIGKSGNGKSSTGNTLLGQGLFDVSTGINTCTRHTQLREATQSHNNDVLTLQVVDLPDVGQDMDARKQDREIQLCQTLTFPKPTVVGLVVRADVRFTPTDYAIYRSTLRLLGRRQPGDRPEQDRHGAGTRPAKERPGIEDAPVPDNLVVIFTMRDVLPADQQRSFGEEVQKANQELKQVLQDARGRFVLLSNLQHPGESDSSNRSQLMDIVLRVHQAQPSEARPLSAMLVGTPGTGKSATGHSLLYPRSCGFLVHMGLSSATRPCQPEMIKVAGLELTVTDTPAWSDKDHEQPLSPQLNSWLTNPQDTPHVFLWVLKAHDRFQEHEVRFFAAMKRALGNDIKDRVLVVFTGGDYLQQSGTTMEDLLRQAPEDLKRILEELNNRYVLVNNQASSATERLLQRNRLLEAMAHRLVGHKGRLQRGSSQRYERRNQPGNDKRRKSDDSNRRGPAIPSDTSQPTGSPSAKDNRVCVLS